MIVGGKKYLSSEEINGNQGCWKFIVEQLKEKAERAETVEEGKKLCLRKGEGPVLTWLNIDEQAAVPIPKLFSHDKLIWSFRGLDYTESFLAWHIATELCFRFDGKEENTTAAEESDYRSIAKVISCYMFYLFETEHPMIASVFVDSKALREGTCNHVKKALSKYHKGLETAGIKEPEEEDGRGRIKYTDYNENNKEKYVYATEGRPVYARKGDSGKLFAMDRVYFEGMEFKTALENARKLVDELEEVGKNARKLVDELEDVGKNARKVVDGLEEVGKNAQKVVGELELEEEGGSMFPWKLISQVWVEIMCYAAINCRPDIHAQQPSQGGQLLTFVWLLMNNLGLGTNFSHDNE